MHSTNKNIEAATEAQQAVLQQFVEACKGDKRVAAAFLSGSQGKGTADQYSDLDLYLITTGEAYDDFFADRRTFIQKLGEPIFFYDFNGFGFDMILFTFADGVEGELVLAQKNRFERIYSGLYRILVDKEGILDQKVFPSLSPTVEKQSDTLQWRILWFWRWLSRFVTAIHRKRLWNAYGMLNLLRVYCVEMAHLQHDFSSEVDGYYKVEEVVPAQVLRPLQSTFCPLERDAMITAVLTIVEFYRGIAPPLAACHSMVYPVDLDRVLSQRLEFLRD